MHPDPDLLRAIIDGSSDAVFVKDRTGRYLFVNDSAAAMLGRAPADVVGRTDHDLVPAEAAAAFVATDQRIMELGAAETHDETARIGGQRRVLQTRKLPYRDATGAIVGVIGIATDITARADARAALEQHERWLKLVIDTLPVGILVVDTSGDIVLGNGAAERIWAGSIQHGRERWKRSRGWWHHSGVALEPHEWASVQALSTGQPVLDQIVDIEAFDGSRRTIRNASVPLVGPRGLEGAVILNEDITARLSLETQLIQAQKLEAVGRLAGGVAHDFNNLLMVICTYVDMLRPSFDAADPRRDDVEEIHRAVESATGLTRQLLAFGRRDVQQPREVELEVVVAATQKLLGRVLGEGVRLESDLALTRNTVWLDPVQLDQLLLNLALNARDAMPRGGTLTIATRTLPDQRAVLSVRDTGIGMDEHTRLHLFEPFFTTKARGHGTGLGLATVFSIVERAGGTIRVDSAPGRGSTFAIELPIHTPAPPLAPGSTDPAESALRGTETVLLVEDAPPVRIAVRGMLTRLGYAVHDVSDAAEALAYVEGGGTLDLLLTDVMLGGMNGRELADTLHARRPELRVLLMSGYADDELLLGGPLGPDRRLLRKPFSAPVLAAALREVLDA